MNDIVKKALLFGIGSIYYTREKVESFVNELKTDQNITPEEGKKLVEEVMNKVDEFRKTQSQEIKKNLSEAISELGLATKKDLDELAAKINQNK